MNRTICGPDGALHPQIGQLVRRKARQLSRLRALRHLDRPDIQQELLLELVKKFAQFDAHRSCLTTFASRIIESKAASLVRAARAEKRNYRHEAFSLNATIDDGEGRTVEIAETIEDDYGRRHTGQRSRSKAEVAHLKLDLAEINHNLPLPLREVAAVLSHVPQFAASQVLGISRRQTANYVSSLQELYQRCGLTA